MVKVRGRNSNGKTVKQTVKNGRKIWGDDAAQPAWVTGARRQQFAAVSRLWSIPNLLPRSTVTRVWLTEWAHLGQLCGNTDIYLFWKIFLSFRECCLTRQWQSRECDTRYMVQRKKFEVIPSFLVDRYRWTKPPKPDASQFVVPARLHKPVIGSGGLSSSRFDDDVPEVMINCTWTASFSWRVKEAALWFESYGSKNLQLTGGTTWSSQSTSTDWFTRTHHWSSPRSKLAYQKPTSTRKLRTFRVTSGQGSKHRDWTASRWWARHGDPAADQIVRGPSGGCRGDLISKPDSGYYSILKIVSVGKLTFWRVFWKAKSSSFVLVQKSFVQGKKLAKLRKEEDRWSQLAPTVGPTAPTVGPMQVSVYREIFNFSWRVAKSVLSSTVRRWNVKKKKERRQKKTVPKGKEKRFL